MLMAGLTFSILIRAQNITPFKQEDRAVFTANSITDDGLFIKSNPIIVSLL